MKRVSLVLAVVGLLLVTAFVVLFASGHAVAIDRFDKVAVGMTEAEVRAIAGTPERVRHDHPDSTEFFYGGFRRLKWCTVEVYFGADGRVTGKFHDH